MKACYHRSLLFLIVFISYLNLSEPATISQFINLLPGLLSDLKDLGGLQNVISKAMLLTTPIENASKPCKDSMTSAAEGFISTSIQLLKTGIRSSDNWQFHMLDSFGKIAGGLNQLNFQWLGNFKECLEIGSESSRIDSHPALMAALNLDRKYHSPTPPPFRGEYCLVEFSPHYQRNLLTEKLKINIGMCFPSTCSLHDKAAIIRHYSQVLPVDANVNEEFCQSEAHPRTMDAVTLAILCVLLTIICITLTANAIDCCTEYTTSLTKTNAIIANKFDYIEGYEDVFTQFSFTSRFGFDTLFQLTSFTVAYELLLYFQDFGIKAIFPVVGRRLIKLYPTYLVVVSLMVGPVSYMGDGPLWPRQILLTNYCRQRWWTLLLFIYNVNEDPHKCNPTFWYPSVDMQLLFLIPLLIYLIYKAPKFGFIAVATLWTLSVLFWVTFVYLKDVTVVPSVTLAIETLNTTRANFDDMYMQPWGHLAPLLSGAATAYALYTHPNIIDQLKTWKVVSGWLMSLSIMFVVVYGTYPLVSSRTEVSTSTNVIYGSLSCHVWPMAIAWLTLFISSKQRGKSLRWFFGQKYFRVLGRMSYSAYLAHFMFINHYFHSAKVLLHFDSYNNIVLLLTVTTFSYAAGFILTLLVEMPIVNMTKTSPFATQQPNLHTTSYKRLNSDSEESEIK